MTSLPQSRYARLVIGQFSWRHSMPHSPWISPQHVPLLPSSSCCALTYNGACTGHCVPSGTQHHLADSAAVLPVDRGRRSHRCFLCRQCCSSRHQSLDHHTYIVAGSVLCLRSLSAPVAPILVVYSTPRPYSVSTTHGGWCIHRHSCGRH